MSMNAHPGPFTNAALVPNALTEFPDMSANVRPVIKVTAVPAAWQLKSAPVANPTLTVPTMLSAVKTERAAVDLDSKQPEPSA